MAGIQIDPRRTMQKAIMYASADAGSLLERLLFRVFRPIVTHLPPRTLARLKELINPVIRLDYAKQDIFLHADSELTMRRARACAKEPETIQWIEDSVRPNEVFYDIGANVGAYSLVASKYLDGRVRVYSFEPSFSTYDELCQNVILNHCEDSVQPYMIALTDSMHLVEFDYRSLDAGAAEHLTASRAPGGPRVFEPVYRQNSIGFGLDDLVANYGFPSPNHMKIDVDGAEYEILLGASRILRSENLRSMLIEVDEGQLERVRQLLVGAGFEIDSMHERGNGVVWNVIFCRKLDESPRSRSDA